MLLASLTKTMLQQGQDLSIEILWIYIAHRAAKLQAVKVEGLKKNPAARPELSHMYVPLV